MNAIKKAFFFNGITEYIEAGRAKTAVFFSEAVVSGEKELYDVYSVDSDKIKLLKIAASMVCDTDFPYAAALQKAAAKMEIKTQAASIETHGKSLCAKISGKKYFLGNKRFMKDNGIKIPYGISHADFTGYSVSYIAAGKEFLGLFLFYDELLSEALSAIRCFNSIGIKTVLLGRVQSSDLLKKRTGADEVFGVILSAKREKVLQGMENSDKIIVIKERGQIEKCLSSFLYGKRILKNRKVNIIAVSALIALCALFITLPLFLMLFCINTFAFMLYGMLTLRRISFDMPDITEEEMMFGKVKYTMNISGMSCAHCSAHVKSALESIRGVSAEISLEEKLARIKCPASLDVEKLTKAVSDAGYTVNSVEKV